MNPALKDMLVAYRPETPADYQNAAREIVQEIALLGLWRGGFFEHAAFYGGTALRIFHGLRRFSEDLDFTLVEPGDATRLERYLPGVATELESWGFSFETEPKSAGGESGIESAFLKGSTQLLPTPYQVRLYDLPSLFAGKLHAVLCRGWKSRVKGRDFYDFVWYVGRGIQPNLEHLEARMRQSGHWNGGAITRNVLVDLLRDRFAAIDFKQAADEVRVFLPDPRELQLWSRDFFDGLAGRLGEG